MGAERKASKTIRSLLAEAKKAFQEQPFAAHSRKEDAQSGAAVLFAPPRVVRRAGRILLERPLDQSPLRGEWDLPAVEIAEAADPRVELRTAIRRRHGLTLAVGRESRAARHAILYRRLKLEAFECTVGSGGGRVGASRRGDLRWIRERGLGEAAVSGATRKLLGPGGR